MAGVWQQRFRFMAFQVWSSWWCREPLVWKLRLWRAKRGRIFISQPFSVKAQALDGFKHQRSFATCHLIVKNSVICMWHNFFRWVGPTTCKKDMWSAQVTGTHVLDGLFDVFHSSSLKGIIDRSQMLGVSARSHSVVVLGYTILWLHNVQASALCCYRWSLEKAVASAQVKSNLIQQGFQCWTVPETWLFTWLLRLCVLLTSNLIYQVWCDVCWRDLT